MPESLTHKDIKYDFYWDIINNDEYAKVEAGIGATRTDIFTEVNGQTLAIELQHTSISVANILRRMREHTAKGAHTLWLITPEALAYDTHYCKNLKWVLFIQAMQNGVIFLPSKGSKILPARVDNTLTVYKNELYATSKKYLDVQKEIDLDKLVFSNYHNYNIVTYPEWWLDNNMDLWC